MAQETISPTGADQTASVPWLPVLMYHRVVPELDGEDPYRICITTRDFEAQMEFLATAGYRVVQLEALVADLQAGVHEERQAVITFDDGCLDVFQNAVPILDRYGFPATMFLVTDHIGRTNSWDEGRAEQVPLLGQREIEEMRADGWSFGSHSRTHRRLGQLAPEDAWVEIDGSRQRLRAELGIDATTFCYPYGSVTPETKEQVRRAGYEAACGIDRFQHSLFDLSRIDAAACGGTGLLWRMKVSGLHRKVRGNGLLRSLRAMASRGRTR